MDERRELVGEHRKFRCQGESYLFVLFTMEAKQTITTRSRDRPPPQRVLQVVLLSLI